MTFVGLDTRSALALFHLAEPGGERPPALLEVPAEGGLAYFHRPGVRVFGGSVGPGPVLAFERCGEDCLEVFQWRAWAWKRLGDSLEVPAAATLHATYDLAGAPWVVFLGATAVRGRQRAWAFRWEADEDEAGRWRRHGPLSVDAVGEPAAVPDPGRKDAILVGSGRFNADDFARSWLPTLPDLPREQMAEVFPLAGDTAVVLAADGSTYLTPDGGATWQRTEGTPPRSDGTEIWFDRPTGDRTGVLGGIWVDAEAPRPQLIVTEISPTSPEKGWQEVVRVPSEVVTDTGTRLAFAHFLRPDGRRWWLLTGCTDAPAASGLVVRGPEDLGKPRFVSITAP